MDKKKAITEINRAGVLLVFPIKNAPEPASLWTRIHPRKKMKWEWTEDSDDSVADLWHLMKRLSDCREVVYSKWYQGRATFFSRELFAALLRYTGARTEGLSQDAKNILEILEMDSPLSTREIKVRADLQGRFNESAYNRAMKALFLRFLIVGFGEVDDGAFPSLAVGATRTLYEDLWEASGDLRPELAAGLVEKYFPEGSKLRRHLNRVIHPPE